MAFVRDRFNKYYGIRYHYVVDFFKTSTKYEETIMSWYTPSTNLIYTNPQDKDAGKFEMEATKALEKNPYWLLYDLIKN